MSRSVLSPRELPRKLIKASDFSNLDPEKFPWIQGTDTYDVSAKLAKHLHRYGQLMKFSSSVLQQYERASQTEIEKDLSVLSDPRVYTGARCVACIVASCSGDSDAFGIWLGCVPLFASRLLRQLHVLQPLFY
jgi:hypothetical protein